MVSVRPIVPGDEFVARASTPGWARQKSTRHGILVEDDEFSIFLPIEEIGLAVDRMRQNMRRYGKAKHQGSV